MSDVILDGKRVFVATGGVPFDPARPVLLLVHGAGMDHSVWSLQDRALAHGGFAVLSVDLPGHGRSDGPALPSVAAIADWLAAVIAAAGATQVAAVGHSLGSLAVLALAARHPEKVRTLGLIGAAATMPVHPTLLTAALETPESAFDMITGWGFSPRAARGGSPVPGLWMTGGGRALLRRAAAGVLHNDLSACTCYADGMRDAQAVSCPAVLILGQQDKMTPVKAGLALAAALPQAHSHILPGAGHMMMAEQPDAVVKILKTLHDQRR